MLKSLFIENYALIDKLNIDFDAGFSVITGETGAGKSIILGALTLILGQRADTKTIKDGQNKCVIEGVFNIADYHLNSFFTDNELDYDDNCIIRREILANGKSRSFINDTPININLLKDLGNLLIDIHSQHENLLITNKAFQLNIVDTVAQTQALVVDFQLKFQELKKLKLEITQLTETAEKEKADTDYLQFQLSQLQEARLQENEQTEMEAELEILTHTEDIKTALSKVDFLLSDEDKGVLTALKEAKKTTSSIAPIFHKINEANARLESCYIELKDLASEISVTENDLDFSPDRLQIVNDRLNLIYTLEQKHRVKSVEELIEIQASLEQKLQQINSFDAQLESLNKKKEELFNALLIKAKELSKKRKEITKHIESTICNQLSLLGMPSVQFVVSIAENEELNANGINEIAFLFSANKNIAPQAIEKIASGGEISRVMLCIKSLLSNKVGVPTIIFDEIDTGVSGDIADKMGDIMEQMGEKMQVISITHLPQIAAKGSAQYKVFKTENEETTGTQIKKLNNKERITEVAQMLSGATLTDAAIRNAEVLLQQHLN
jgi:DNA repair protein RecN (Recombination protein N)